MGSPKKTSISILHHHLEPGGVTQVVDLAVRALSSHLQDLKEVRLVTGRSGGAEILASRLEKECAPRGISVRLAIIAEIDYLPADIGPGKESDKLESIIKRELLGACAGSVWMVHNYHLGKNPLFTHALLEIADENPNERICFYIHDFPECARYENLSFLRQFVPDSPYPVRANVRYAVINSRDLKYLTGAGIPESMVFLLNDPVPEEELPRGVTHKRRTHIEKYFGDDFPAYDPDAPLLFYPVRTIRRKNILEMGLICAASPMPVNLVVTLPGTSQTEKAYSGQVSAAFETGLIPGLWGVGSRLEEAGITFPELLSTADLICSSSVQEGFGYLFINAVAWGIPLFARYLDILDGISEVFDGHPCHFYRSFRIPAVPGDTAAVNAAYEKKADRLTALAGKEIVNMIAAQITSVADEESIEFSYLSIESQIGVLKKVKADTGYRDAVRCLNRQTYDELRMLCAMGRKIGAQTEKRQWPFTFERYAATVQTIIDSFEKSQEPKSATGVQSALIRRFSEIEYLRLLYGN
jgi:hypothetical protein